MTAPIPEERDEETLPTTQTPPGEHRDGDLPDGADGDQAAAAEQRHNAETTEDEPSQ